MIFEKLGIRDCPVCKHKIKPKFKTEKIEKEADIFKEYIFCSNCQHRMEKRTRSHFSYNTTEGACPTCKGLGEVVNIHRESVFHQHLSIESGAVELWQGRYGDYQVEALKNALKYYGVPISIETPLKQYNPKQKAILYYGTESDEVKGHFPNIKPPKTVAEGKFEGVLTGMWRRFDEKSGTSAEAKKYFHSQNCPDCHGDRLNKVSKIVIVENLTIPNLVKNSLENMFIWIGDLEKTLSEENYKIVKTFILDLKTKLKRIVKVGLGYLTLDRQIVTLSGGETQRLRLSALLDSALTGVLYIMDEPTVGLHPKDTKGLVSVLKRLRDLGNTVLLIEHDLDVMKEADYIIDIGPGAGSHGGSVVGHGTLDELPHQEMSVTGKYLSAETEMKKTYRSGTGERITVHKAKINNLKDITVTFPIGSLISVTGVSGSGKSSLVFEVLAKGKDKIQNGFDRVTGLEKFEQIIIVGQSPLSRMKRSNIATYIDVFTPIRNIFAKTKEAKDKKLTAKHFSFNTVGGRCENCQGLGYVTTNMLFFPEMEVVCPVCHVKRFQDEVISVKYNSLSINNILVCI